MINNCDERKELLVTDMGAVFEPKSNMKETGEKGFWRTVSYENGDFSGVAVSSFDDVAPGDISYNPELKGYYKIFVTLPTFSDCMTVFIKLSTDESYCRLGTQHKYHGGMEEVLWRCADMTDCKISLTRSIDDTHSPAVVCAFRFVPMNDDEVAEFIKEKNRKDTKRLYCSNDMHNIYYYLNPNSIDDFLTAVLPLENSDAEWFSPEYIRLACSGKCPVPPENFAFEEVGMYNFMRQFERYDCCDALRVMADKVHRMGIKFAPSFRMSPWGMQYPLDHCNFDSKFAETHPQFRCIERNGEETNALSLAYSEVRKYLIDGIVESAKCDADAVTLISHRGTPYVLFEKPVADRFYELYGEYPYELPLDEPRLNALHCEFVAVFFKELRETLDENCGKDKVQIHVRSFFSVADAKYMGYDFDKLGEQGLVNAIISYPQRIYEVVPDYIRKADCPERIDLEKYTKFIHSNEFSLCFTQDYDFEPPYINSRGEEAGPKTQAERVKEWMQLEEKHSIKIYFDLMPRIMPNAELQRRVLELYDLGAERFAFWDTNSRVARTPMWNLCKKLGHKEELAAMDPFVNEYKLLRIGRYGDKNMTRWQPSWVG